MSLLQDGSGIPFLAPPVFQYLCGTSAEHVQVCIDDSPTLEVKGLVQSVSRNCTVVNVCVCVCACVCLRDIHTVQGYSLTLTKTHAIATTN